VTIHIDLHEGTYGWTYIYVRMDSHVTTIFLEIDGLSNFTRYGAPLARLIARELRYNVSVCYCKVFCSCFEF